MMTPDRTKPLLTWRGLSFLLVTTLTGCAAPQLVPEPEPEPPVAVSGETWQQIDCEIVIAARAASEPVQAFARRRMEDWRQLATQQAEVEFIPWFSSYWTQQWLSAKVAWYTLNQNGGQPPVDRLSAYLQGQYHDRVLAPVAETVDPKALVGEATRRYVDELAGRLRRMPAHHGIPPSQFQQHLATIPAIVLAPPASHHAMLGQVLDGAYLASQPAYLALIRQYSEAGGVAGAGLSTQRISPLARRLSEKLLDRLAISGGSGAVSALVGGVAGSLISLGAAGIGLALHESERQEIERQLREILQVSMDDMWRILVDDPQTGVTAGVHYLVGRIEKICPTELVLPVRLDRPPEEIPLPALPSIEEPPAEGREPAPDGQGAAPGGAARWRLGLAGATMKWQDGIADAWLASPVNGPLRRNRVEDG